MVTIPMAQQMDFCLLGPLEVRCGGTTVAIPGGKQRALLAALLLEAGQAVPVPRLAEALWGPVPPRSAQVTVQNYVKRLRQVLGEAGRSRIGTRSRGYTISVHPGEVDVTRFEALLGAARAAARNGSWDSAVAGAHDALSMWRGEPLADIGSEYLTLREAPRLAELRLQAIELRIEADLQLGRHAKVIAELRALTSVHPLRERLHALMMLALYRDGRQGDALAAYQRARRVLVDELGAEPGDGLREMHRRILAADPVLAGAAPGGTGPLWAARSLAVPRQLPGAIPYFAGRAGQLAELDRLLGAAGPGQPAGAAVVAAISGTAGVGKTALAVHWAHRAACHFPDGQLHANLRGFDPSGVPVTPGQAIRQFLDALGVAPDRIPASLEAQAGLYRSLLAGRRMLIVLDNARDAAQVRPLLPASGNCVVLVTSRCQLAGLAVAGGASLLILDVLSWAEASELLTIRLGAARASREPAAVTELAGLCARLPLALSIAAARASTRPGVPLAVLAAGLRDSHARLDELETGEHCTSVRAVFSWSCRPLRGPMSLMFALLGMHPGPDITAAAAASMAAMPAADTGEALHQLARVHLVSEHRPGRFSCHDLLRAYAAELAREHGGDSVLQLARRRLREHYLHTAARATAILYPARLPLPLRPPSPGVAPEQLAGHAQAQDWLRAEHQVLLAVAGQAAGPGTGPHGWQLPVVLTDYLNRHGHWHDLADLQRAALTAARQLGDLAGQAHARQALGTACFKLGSYQAAASHLGLAATLFQRLEDRACQARTHITVAAVTSRQGHPASALRHAERAFCLFQEAGHLAGMAHALMEAGLYLAHLGDYQQALTVTRRALQLNAVVGNRLGQAHTWGNLGYVLDQLGRHGEAITCYHSALDLFGDVSDRYEQAVVLSRLGDAQAAAGDSRSARGAWQQAAAILQELDHADVERVQARLRDYGVAGTPAAAW